ncbi:ATP-binding cassette domain-containing protein [Streptomyces sp. NPDC004610]|uniref:ATP-binding cassette domain-containing protein n=1 Tax=unclassified Streptomyces TaxID=2593676 RepID=UPI0033BAF60B
MRSENTAGPEEAGPPLLAIRNVTVYFGTTAPFRTISLTARRGETIALDGPSGTGKTTLLRVAAGLLPPSSGTVRHAPGTTRTTLFQDPRLLPWRTVRDNVLYGLGRRPTPLEADRADDLLAHLDLDTAAALRPDEISGGMRRRTALARALLPAPDLLLADEPFAHLDPEWSDTVENLLRTTAASGTAILLTAHQPTRLRRLASTVLDIRTGTTSNTDPCTSTGSGTGTGSDTDTGSGSGSGSDTEATDARLPHTAIKRSAQKTTAIAKRSESVRKHHTDAP